MTMTSEKIDERKDVSGLEKNWETIRLEEKVSAECQH